MQLIESKLSFFKEFEADFYHYMITHGGIAKKTSHDYISRMRYLSARYTFDRSFSQDKIDAIMFQERQLMASRDKYNTPKAMSDFHAGLKKFLSFIEFDYKSQIERIEKEEIQKVLHNSKLSETERNQIIKSRIGQGTFRSSLIDYWHGCSISCFSIIRLLIASHIKPWSVSNNEQRLDVFNGLLLLPNYDKMFDTGYITFDNLGKIICSKLLDSASREILGLHSNICLTMISPKHLPYLKYHRDNVFIG